MTIFEENKTIPNNRPILPTIERKQTLTITLSLENAAWLVLAVTALLTRLINLGARVMSHDESLHVYYSWLLSKGSGYVHNPMMHGPFLFEATAALNVFFGTNDFTSRLLPALLGMVIVIIIPLLLRPWLGRAGALLASLFFLVSPYILYYSRYNRHDIQVIAWVLMMVYAMQAYLRERHYRHLLLLAVALALMLSTMEISFIYLAIFAGYLVVCLLSQYGLRWKEIRCTPECDLLVVLATLGAFFASPIALLILNPIWARITGQPFVDFKVLADYGTNWANGPAGVRLSGLMGVFWVAAGLVGCWWGKRRWLPLAGLFMGITVTLFTTFFTNLGGIGTGFVGSLGYWLSQQEVSRGSQPLYYYLLVFPIYEYLPLLGGLAASIYSAVRARSLSSQERAFVPLLAWWAVVMFIGLSLAGEKMPWLSTHITVPFILLTGWFAGKIFTRLLLSIQPGITIHWPALAAGLPLAVLFLMTVRTSYLVNYVNYDYTTEFIGYAHGAPGVKWAMGDIERIANRLGQGKSMTVAYDSETSWPMTWYLRDHPGFFGDQPNRGALENVPVIVASTKNWQKVEAYVGADYSRYEVIRMWWPMEDYRNLTWDRIRGALNDPQMRQALWNIFWSRDYRLYEQLTQQEMNPPNKWPLEDRMRVYIRKDIAVQVPALKLEASKLADLPSADMAFAGKQFETSPKQVISPIEISAPRNLAVAADGTIYLLDSGGSRVLVLNAAGQEIAAWGSSSGTDIPPAPGTFNEPWGIALDGDGNVYVADTWNHRIQKFDSSGKFLLEWGSGGMAVDGQDRFWGPRGIAINADGKVYVTDTGNRRILAFDTQGTFMFEFESQGDAQLDEPVGIAIGADQRVYVADTWNRRVAVFTLDGKYERSWIVSGWASASVDNKPYIALDDQNRVYLTDPEGYRVLVYTNDGTPLAALGEYGDEPPAFNLPTGIQLTSDGSLWVVDTAKNRVVAFSPADLSNR